MTREEIKNRLKAGESVEFIMYETGKSFDDIYEIFEECKKEGYVKVHRSNRLRRRTPNGKLVYVPKTSGRPEVYINIDRISSIVKDGHEISVYVDDIGYRINDEILKAITLKMGVI